MEGEITVDSCKGEPFFLFALSSSYSPFYQAFGRAE
jgi:hypothetical protein